MAKPGPTVLTVKEVAARLRCGVKSVCNLIRRGHLRAALIGHQYRIAPEALDALFAARRLVRRSPKPRRRARHG
jgi:excisionase family DNA binding protein